MAERTGRTAVRCRLPKKLEEILQSCNPIVEISIPSIKIPPSAASRILNNASKSEDLPEPVRPAHCVESYVKSTPLNPKECTYTNFFSRTLFSRYQWSSSQVST